MRRKCIFVFLLVIIVIATSIFAILLYKNKYESQGKYFEKKYGIDFPNRIKLEYKITEMDLHGKGLKYAVFILKNEAINDFLTKLNKEKDYKGLEFKKNVNRIISNFDNGIDNRFFPPWELEYYFLSLSIGQAQLNILYLPELSWLIACEEII